MPGDQFSHLAVLPAHGEGELAVGEDLLESAGDGAEHDDVADLAQDAGVDAEGVHGVLQSRE